MKKWMRFVLMLSLFIAGTMALGIKAEAAVDSRFTDNGMEFLVLQEEPTRKVSLVAINEGPSSVVIPSKVMNDKKEYSVSQIGINEDDSENLDGEDSEYTVLKYSVKNLTIPSSVKVIGFKAFIGPEILARENNKFQKIAFSEGLEVIGSYAFAYQNLAGAKFPQSLKEIKTGTFFKTNFSPDLLEIPSQVKKIGTSSFENCYTLNVKFNEGLEEIGDKAFAYVPLQELSLPKSLKKIGNASFVDDRLSNFLGNQPNGTLDLSANPNLEIGIDNFQGAFVKKAIFPKNMKNIPPGTFDWCEKLEIGSIVWPEKLESLSGFNCINMYGENAICDLRKLPSTLRRMEDVFFNVNMRSFIIPANVVSLDNWMLEKHRTPECDPTAYANEIVFTGKNPNVEKITLPQYPGLQVLESENGGWQSKDGTRFTDGADITEYYKQADFPIVFKYRRAGQEPIFDDTWSGNSSNALIKMLKTSPTGSFTFKNLATTAAIQFPQVTLTDKAQTVKEETASNVQVLDDRSEKSEDWEVQVKLLDKNFTDAGLKITLQPTSKDTLNHEESLTLNEQASPLFYQGTDKTLTTYETLLNGTLSVPNNVTSEGQFKTVIEWTLSPKV